MKISIFICLLSVSFVSLEHRLCNLNEYWSNEEEICLPCTKCPPHQLTMRPCQGHKDTVCKPMSNLSKLDLPWVKRKHHKTTIHFETDNIDDNDDDIYKDIFSKHLDKLGHSKRQKDFDHRKNKKHYTFGQRVNDKFLDWDDVEEVNSRKHRKHSILPLENKRQHILEPLSSSKDDDDDDFSDELPHKKHSMFRFDSKLQEKANKKSSHHSKIEDEDILKQWLMQSKKQFKLKKKNLLKNLKDEKSDIDSEESSFSNKDSTSSSKEDYADRKKKVKLNYPLYNNKGKIDNWQHSNSHKEVQHKYFADVDEQLFKDLIKTDEREMDLATLLSNKREPFSYKSASSSHNMFLSEPSSISELMGRLNNPGEMIKEEVGRNVIYEKSKISVLPMPKDNEADVISVPFTAAERFVWDWQALALCSALFACLVFFIVVAMYSIINTRQWKRTKRNYTTELEEMSTRIALMHPTSEVVMPEKCETSKIENFPSNDSQKS
ncbi:uncharacterized protein LOC106669879 [Cimex lectularius]|uniref:TNFR-Cys domain-containing protein n=1 Tax=Cimex lectularius TaxID=79782 RepID=A0A8I6RZH1_CIMLE|nr:uncharacterized protein LOC106669879 [Cimex lectularius]